VNLENVLGDNNQANSQITWKNMNECTFKIHFEMVFKQVQKFTWRPSSNECIRAPCSRKKAWFGIYWRQQLRESQEG